MGLPMLVWMDILLASVTAGLLTSFATAERARDSAARMYHRHRTVRTGLIVAGAGLSVLTVGLTLEALGNDAAGGPLHALGTPAVVAGVVVVASTTWRRGGERADEAASGEALASEEADPA